jgi:hypothetical protein
MLAVKVMKLGMATSDSGEVWNNGSGGDEVGNCENSETNW